ncbi:MAG: EamA family transporter [Bacteroidota bacterium]|mgnify:CR=1 FL=1
MVPSSGSYSRSTAVAGFIGICLIWGSTWLAIKEGLHTVPPFMSAAIRFVLAAILLRLVMWHQGESIPRSREYWSLIGETGFLTYAIPFALIYWGQNQIPSGLSAILFATYPFFVALAARVRIPGERLSAMRVLGVLLGFVGVFTIFSTEMTLTDRVLSPLGMGAIVLSAFMQAYALITIRMKAQHVHPATLTFGGMIVGAVFLSILSVMLEDASSAVFDARTLISIAYLSAFGTTFTFITYFWLIKHVHPVLLSLTAFITPIIAVTLGSVVLQENLGVEVLAGASLVLTGVLVANVPGLRTYFLKRREDAAK